VKLKKAPGDIDIGKFVCHHGDIALDPSNPKHMAEIVLLNDDQWKRIKSKYNSYAEIKYDYKNKKNNEITPKPCRECLEQREKLEKEALLQFQDKEVQLICSNAPPESSWQTAGVRRSKRNKNKETISKVVCSATDTIGLLRLKIFESLNIAPNCQSLWVEDRPLDREDFTLYMYQITPESTIRLQQIENTEFMDIEIIEPKWAQQKEEGFKGTNLYSSPKNEEEDDSDDKEDNEEPEWECPTCTYKNTGDSCKFCGKSFWECSQCTLRNEVEDKECKACQAIKETN